MDLSPSRATVYYIDPPPFFGGVVKIDPAGRSSPYGMSSSFGSSAFARHYSRNLVRFIYTHYLDVSVHMLLFTPIISA